VSEESLRDLFPDDLAWSWSMGLRLEDPGAMDKIVTLIEETLHRSTPRSLP
jgi:hypothetical protein